MYKQDWDREEEIIFKKFKNSLNKIKTLHEAKLLRKEFPPPDHPGRAYYVRFLLLIDNDYLIPDVKSEEEILLYKIVIKNLFENGDLKSTDFKSIIDRIDNYINEKFH